VYTITIDDDLHDGDTTLVDCGSLNVYFINFVVASCADGVLAADPGACEESETKTIITSKVSMSLTGGAGTTGEELEEALGTEESQAALLASLAESLGIDSTRINIIGVTVTAVRRLKAARSRHLTTSSSFTVVLDYEVETDSSINDTDTLQQSMAAIGETNSTVSSMFSTSLVANLEVAANQAANSTGSVLSAIVEQVREEGLKVAVAETPVIIIRDITTTTTTTTATTATTLSSVPGSTTPGTTTTTPTSTNTEGASGTSSSVAVGTGFMVYILVILVLAVIVLLVTCGPVLLLMRSGKRAKVAGENQEAMTVVPLEEGSDEEAGSHRAWSSEGSDPTWLHIRRASDAPPGPPKIPALPVMFQEKNELPGMLP